MMVRNEIKEGEELRRGERGYGCKDVWYKEKENGGVGP